MAAGAVSGAPRPKLTILLVAELFRPEYLDRYRSSFSAGGFNRLLKGGAVFRQCRYEYMTTFPATGAAVLATGAYPERNGIVAERWYDRQSRKVEGAVEDPEYLLVGSDQPKQPGSSPRNLRGTTLADELRLATGGRSRALSISLREPTAVLLAGRRPVGCYWLDAAGRFVTSSYYADALPSWAAAFEKKHPLQRFRGRPWKALDAKENAPPLRVIDGREAYLASPFAMEEEFDFARDGVTGEELGQGGSSDLLVISVSSLYLLGLEVGADSPLMRDVILRLDRKMEEFLSWLDTKFGADKISVVFAATQGVPDLPETLQSEGIPAGRISGEQIAAAVNARLTAAFGRGQYVEKYVFPFLYLRREVIEGLSEAARLAGEGALSVPGVAGYLVPNGASSFQATETVRAMARCWFPERTGDVLIAYQPHYMELYGDGRGVSPGSVYSYDTRVPLVFYGAAFQSQVFERPVSAADMAATLAAALEISPPSPSIGKVLFEALKNR